MNNLVFLKVFCSTIIQKILNRSDKYPKVNGIKNLKNHCLFKVFGSI